MKTKHTPGPWIAMNTFIEGPWFLYRNKSNISAIPIASVNKELDAQLIAAAPDLLKGLNALVKEELLCEHEGLPEFQAVTTRRKNAAYKAIQKAEGSY